MTVAFPILRRSIAKKPPGWAEQRIGDVVELVNGFPFPSDSFSIAGDIPLIRIRDLTASEFETYIQRPAPQRVMVRNGDIVVGMDGGFNVVRWNRGPAALNQRLCLLRPKSGVDIRFVAYWLPALLRVLNDLAYSTTVKHLSSGEILSERVLMPALEEQQRIANFLDDEVARIDLIIELRRSQRAGLQERLASWLDERLVRALSASANRPLADLTDRKRPIQYGIVLPGPDFPGGVPIVKGGDIGSGRIATGPLQRTDPAIDAVYARSRVVGGDIVIAIRGSVGELATVPDSLSGANLTQDSARIAPWGVDPRWLLAALRTPTVQARMQRLVTGATVKGINIFDLRRIPVPTPALPEQQMLAAQISDIETGTSEAVSAIDRSEALMAERRQGLINAAVTGQLDVTTARAVA